MRLVSLLCGAARSRNCRWRHLVRRRGRIELPGENRLRGQRDTPRSKGGPRLARRRSSRLPAPPRGPAIGHARFPRVRGWRSRLARVRWRPFGPAVPSPGRLF